ncbi:hypothetical protein AAFF_G00137870 [Aldrovandia affinis]|uniref:Cadherin domain-containing protein n=1 Tax=Aldrovandia affinis TaxID=143900 RepID=A0AAD7X2S1_9TELE|nr:hypothetical protein AAFF_G00137870 [Aldrovandia affinis]
MHSKLNKANSQCGVVKWRCGPVLVMKWSIDSGGRMVVAKLFLSSFLLHSLNAASNQPPRFTNYFFQTYLPIYEDELVGTSVAQLSALDVDEEPLVFGVVGEEAQRYFGVEDDTGVVWLRQSLDREVVKDTVNVQILDVNDNAPIFHSQPYAEKIPEVPFNLPMYSSPFHSDVTSINVPSVY